MQVVKNRTTRTVYGQTTNNILTFPIDIQFEIDEVILKSASVFMSSETNSLLTTSQILMIKSSIIDDDQILWHFSPNYYNSSSDMVDFYEVNAHAEPNTHFTVVRRPYRGQYTFTITDIPGTANPLGNGNSADIALTFEFVQFMRQPGHP